MRKDGNNFELERNKECEDCEVWKTAFQSDLKAILVLEGVQVLICRRAACDAFTPLPQHNGSMALKQYQNTQIARLSRHRKEYSV